MTPKDAIESLENASNLCNYIGAKGMTFDLREVIKVIIKLQEEKEEVLARYDR